MVIRIEYVLERVSHGPECPTTGMMNCSYRWHPEGDLEAAVQKHLPLWEKLGTPVQAQMALLVDRHPRMRADFERLVQVALKRLIARELRLF